MRTLGAVHAEQQRFWIALLNLQRTWVTDEGALAFIPPRHRDFSDPPGWSRARAQAYLLNNLELLRESWRRLEAGEPLDYDLLNHGLEGLVLRMQPWTPSRELTRAATSKAELGGRLEILQVTSKTDGVNPGTRYVRATIQRSLYYFAQYVDDRLGDPRYPGVSQGRLHVRADPSGDLVLVAAQVARAPGAPAPTARAQGAEAAAGGGAA